MVVVDETEFESANDPLTVETALKNSVALKRIGGYPVDPGSLVVGETSKIPAVIDEGFKSEIFRITFNQQNQSMFKN